MSIIETLQDLAAQLPEVVQPIVVAVAGAIPFVEGEGAALIGIVAGIHPVVAAVAAMIGNFLCVAALVLLSSGARDAALSRRRGTAQARERAMVGAGPRGEATPTTVTDESRSSARRAKFQRSYERYGVPGVSLLGPLLLPTHFTATMLAATGIGKARILFWQALAIVGWTTIAALIISGVIYVGR